MGPLGCFYHFDDLGEDGFFSYLGRAKMEGALLVDSPADDFVAYSLINRERFTGQHGLIHTTVTLDNFAVDGDFDAGFDDDDVTYN